MDISVKVVVSPKKKLKTNNQKRFPMKHETVDAGKQYKCEEASPAKGSKDGMEMGGENHPMTPKKQITGGLPDDHRTENEKFDY